MAVKDNTGAEIGIIGLQFDIQEYIKLIPSPVIEEPYSLSFINLYDKNFELKVKHNFMIAFIFIDTRIPKGKNYSEY